MLKIICLGDRYAMGTDYKLYKKFLYAYRATYPDLAEILKQWRF